MNANQWNAHSICSAPWGESIKRILEATLQAVEPAAAIRQHMQRSGSELIVDGKTYDLSGYRRILLVGAGKAGAPMAGAVAQVLSERITGGLVIVKDGYAGQASSDVHLPSRQISIVEAGHPVPDKRGVAGARQIMDLLAGTQPDDLVISLISGGGSALLVAPAEGLALDDLQSLTSTLLASGATINEINTLRKHLDQLKGGGLARLAAHGTLVTLILSDVVGDPLDVIASGPTVPDPTTFRQAYQVLERYAIVDQVPQPVLEHLQRGSSGELPESPKPGDPLFDRVQNVVIGSNRQAARAAQDQAQQEGFQALLLTTFLQGEARQAGRIFAAIARQLAATGEPISRPACILAGGETTVTLQGDGSGGRNQEMALSAVGELAGLPDIAFITLATDGGDGPTDAAGAVVTGETLPRSHHLGLDPLDYLARNDSYHFFAALDDLLRPGPTRTNVNDLAFLFAF